MKYVSHNRNVRIAPLTRRTLMVGLSMILVMGLAIVSHAHRLGQGEKTEIQNKVEKAPDKTLVTELEYSTIFYQNGDLKIEAYFYKPKGDGPFPLVVYNHGSRAGSEHKEIPWRYVANVLKANGYAVLVPERRGYGKSDGETFTQEVGNDHADKMMKRCREEASDVIAGIDFIKTYHSVDPNHIAIMGWSHGGVVTLLTASEKHEFVAVIDQAGGALTWDHSPTLQAELPAAAKKIKAPVVCMDAENDATTNAVKEVGQAVRSSGETERTIIYPAFTPSSNPSNIAPGHLIFSAEGMHIWQNDMLQFLQTHLATNRRTDENSPLAQLRL